MIKNRRWLFLAVVSFIIIVAVAGIIAFFDYRYQGLYVYETNDEVISLFESNITDFNEYVDEFEGHTMWDSYYESTGDSDFVNYKGFKQYTTDKEFAFLDSFYNKYHPAFWGQRSLGFYVKSGHVQLIKDNELSAQTQLEIDKAQEAGASIKYYDYGWICIVYPENET